ncbi:MAG: 5-formyltetrahydrofolate cyclo-ligase [Candidatus Terraquivivens tikiterensis]|uniref:5-formyltetrahydrofolate cyclo-ligase n=1 Tax=Candidatus Terraquivivens tikiterensis TaxID=1980982 RepID=A0A2R7Y1T7_9ARCH|nr:MAG: 5-formyltetrahydrofolate cyclo-ligase [Candidatus Terraquivivens tikiterensis]
MSKGASKDEIRKTVWRLLEEKGVARFPRPIFGRIPNFVGAEEAASRLCRTSIYRKAEVVKVNPDSPQLEVRRRTLMDGKMLLMPTPRLSSGFLLLDPKKIPSGSVEWAATIRGSFKFGKPLRPSEVPGVDLIVLGSVAVSREGWRLGKGEGYGEIEYAILRELGKVDERVSIATTVHELQIVECVPHDRYDVPVDYIVTREKFYEVKPRKPKPSGIYWEDLPLEKLNKIPILQQLLDSRGR